jgi:steroid 5-alpha reductase family enzyme
LRNRTLSRSSLRSSLRSCRRITLSFYKAISSPDPWNTYDWFGVIVSTIGILLETFGDMQMNNFIQLKLQKKTDKKVLDTGLWSLSRHPNYLGEILFWWGQYLFQASSGPVWVLAGPLSLTCLFFFVSVDLMEERQIKSKGELFLEYRRKVGSSILLFPPSLNRKLGAFLYPADALTSADLNK